MIDHRFSAPPPTAALDWVRRHTGRVVVQTEALAGGTTAAIHALDLEGGSRVVLKRFVWPEFVAEEPERARHEYAALGVAGAASIPAPEPIAFDEFGDDLDCPAVLMTLVPGTPGPSLSADALADLAVAITQVEPASLEWEYAPYFHGHAITKPPWTQHQEAWETVIAAASSADWGAATLIHRDFHPGNVLEREGAPSGVVDWLSACRGPWQADVAHCRVNLTLHNRANDADDFAARYSDVTGRRYAPVWDAVGVLDVLPHYAGPAAVAEWAGSLVAGSAVDGRSQRANLEEFVLRTAIALD